MKETGKRQEYMLEEKVERTTRFSHTLRLIVTTENRQRNGLYSICNKNPHSQFMI